MLTNAYSTYIIQGSIMHTTRALLRQLKIQFKGVLCMFSDYTEYSQHKFLVPSLLKLHPLMDEEARYQFHFVGLKFYRSCLKKIVAWNKAACINTM